MFAITEEEPSSSSVYTIRAESINLRYILCEHVQLRVPFRHPWLQGHLAIHGQRLGLAIISVLNLF